MKKDSNIIVRIDSELKETAFRIARNNGYKLSDLVTASLRVMCKKGQIPLNWYVYLPPKEYKEYLTITDIKKAVEEIIEKRGKGLVKKAYLFGSYARNEEKSTSDIDIRIETDRGLTLIDLGNIRLDLKETLNKEIDLLCIGKNELDDRFYQSIKKEEICIYER